MSNATDIRWFLFGVAFALFTLGLWLLIRGLRGRRVGDQPTCARCGFDLRGAPEGSTRCPECGADTTARNAVRIGVRRRRPWLVAVGLIWLLLPTLAAVSIFKGFDWRSRLPTRYVLYEARSGSPASRIVPINQLLARDAATPLNADERLALARAMIAVQRDPTNVWQLPWGDWIERRILEGVLPAAEVDAFFANRLADSVVTLRPILGEGQPMPVRIDFVRDGPLWMFGPTAPPTFASSIDLANRRLTIDGKDVPPVGSPLGGWSMQLAPGHAIKNDLDATDAWRALAVGKHRVEWSCPVILRPLAARKPSTAPAGDAPPETARHAFRWSGTIEVVPKGKEVRLVPDPTKEAGIRAALTKLMVRLPGDGQPTLDFVVDELPVDIAFDVFLSQGGGPEQRAGAVRRSAKAVPGLARSFRLPPGKFQPGLATVVLRPSPAAGAETVDLIDIWDGEIRIDDVPVVASN